MKVSLNFWKLLTIGLLSVTLLVLLPFWGSIGRFRVIDLFGNTTFLSAMQMTLLNAFVSAVVLVAFGFAGALLLLKIPVFSFVGKNLGLLIIPITLGNISIAFICKLVWGDTAFFATLAQGSPIGKLGFLLLLELYQYGLLFVYLFWMQLQNIGTERLNFARATKFSFYQRLKDIYLPHTKNLWIFLGAIAFVFTFYEESKIAYLFKVSQGTNSELITNWLTRTYQTNLLVNPDFARKQVFDASYLVFVTALLGIALLFFVLNYMIRQSTKAKLYPAFKPAVQTSGSYKNAGLIFGILLCIIAVFPLILSFTKINFSFHFSQLGFPLLMTFAATLATTVIAIFFGIAARLGWKVRLSSFDEKSLPFFILLFILALAPPIVILIIGYQWMGWVGYASETVIYSVWVVGHILLTLPVLGSFVLFNHFRVSNNEINYLQVYQLSKAETIRFSFLKRFSAEYLLLFIIGYSFIWNEAILNNLFSDYIPSFVSGMKMLITGRGADYDKAFGYLLVSFAVALLSAAIWRYILEKAHKKQATEQ